jgi:hypothetical protein
MKTITNITYTAFALLMLACFALPPQARATCQEGCLTNNNTVLGDDALINNTTGQANTAVGFNALDSNTLGVGNTAIGSSALAGNDTGSDNTATGVNALQTNSSGFNNTATGIGALMRNTTGIENTATGAAALQNNTTGNNNTATGEGALIANTTGHDNTATGGTALNGNTIGFNNTASGVSALVHNTSGSTNTAIGFAALSNNTFGSNNISVGQSAGANLTTGNGNIDIGNRGVAGESRTIRIGTQGTQSTTFMAGISGATVPTGIAVIVDSSGHLGTTTSSARFKEAVKPMDKASEAILVLRPVTFRYKHELDPAGVPQFGLVAEEVEKVNPDLVARDADGKPYTVRYEAVNAMLLNEFLKEHTKVEQLEKDVESKIAEQQKQIEVLTAGLQKVSAQLELSKAAPQTVLNNQ